MIAQQTTQTTTDPKWLLVSMRAVAVVGLVALPLFVVGSEVAAHSIVSVSFVSWAPVLAQSFALGLLSLLLLWWLAPRIGKVFLLPLFLFMTAWFFTAAFLGSSLTSQSVPNLRSGYTDDQRAAIVRQAEAIPRTGFLVALLAFVLYQRIAERRKSGAPQSQAV